MHKPPFLYHGSPHRNINEFKPSANSIRHEEEGAVVFATPDCENMKRNEEPRT